MTQSIAVSISAILFLWAAPVKAQVPVSLMPVVRQQFFGANGLPLAGGFVYTYVAGTSVPAPTYLDYTGTSLNTNPITLDSGGFAAIWIPAAPIDVAVFNSSMTQQYKVLSVTALPIVVTSLTANYFQSSTVNPALSGSLRLANTDSICWRNPGNNLDECLGTSGSTTNNLIWEGTQQVAFLNAFQTWPALQNFTNIEWTSGTPFMSAFTNANTAPRNYFFPDASGTVCISTLCNVNSITVSGVNITGVPVTGQVLTATSPTSAAWGLGGITDYDSYTGFVLVGVTPPVTTTLVTLPAGAVEGTQVVGSFIEGEILINAVTYSGSAPTFQLNVNGVAFGPSVTLATSTSYDVKFTLALTVSRSPQANVNVYESSGTLVSGYTGPIVTITGAAPTVFSYTVSTATTMSLTGQFVHVRVRY